MICNNEVKYVPMETEAREESLGNIALNAFSKGGEALVLAQRIEGYLFGAREEEYGQRSEPHCLRDKIQLHYGVCVEIVNTLRRIVEQLEGS